MYFGDMRVRNNDEREIAERLYAMREAGGKDGEGEIGRGEELLSREWRSTMSAKEVLGQDSEVDLRCLTSQGPRA